ncbi:MAG: TldD/PmbA family protein [Planctomycetes bacterium]|nr:TldD/PmbA family protein [Planctomycetota bacterium]
MKEKLAQALKSATADYAEIRIDQEDSTHIAYRGPEVEDVSSGKYTGGIVRACTNGGWGVATFDSLESLEDCVQEACRCAALVGKDTTALAEIEPLELDVPARMEHDFREVSIDDKLKTIAGYNEIILKSDPAVETSMVAYADTFRTVHFANTRGARFREERPRVVLYAMAPARKDSRVQRATESISSATDYNCILGMEEKILTASKRAVDLLHAPTCKGGAFTVILDPELAGVFVHEAFGHLSEADFLYENPQMRALMCLGKEIGGKGLNIVDDGSYGHTIGTQKVDDEGTPTGKTYLVREGVLSGHLHSLETAAKMGAKPTGNARAIGRSVSPLVRMTNTYIEGGETSFEEMLKGIDKGIYACHALGGQTMMEMFTFSAAHAYRIENGQVGELIRDVTLSGNVFETLKNIEGFGNDFRLIESGGGCGKGGQFPLPVTCGAPHLRISNVVIGGQ